jgi:hypothetical protein
MSEVAPEPDIGSSPFMRQALATAIVSRRGRLRCPVARLYGTAEPALIDKAQSHGCVRLTNWDAKELAGVLERGVAVEFKD